MYLKDNGNLHLLVGGREWVYVFEKSSYAVPTGSVVLFPPRFFFVFISQTSYRILSYCSIENRGYIYFILYIVRANFVLITRKVGGA